MNITLPFVPAPHFDEPALSYIRRVRPFWSKTRFAQSPERDLDKTLYVCSAALPISSLVVDFAGRLTDLPPAHVIEQHTLWSVADMLAPASGAADRVTSITAGRRPPSSCIPTNSWAFGVCMDCVREDQDRYGFATWRRKHLFSAMRVCHEHATPLGELCTSCSGRAEMKSNPRALCACKMPLVCRMPARASSSLIQSELRISEMLAGMTTVAQIVGARARKILGVVYLARAEKLGLTNFTKRPNISVLLELILARFGMEFVASRNLASTDELLGLLRLFSRHRNRSAMPAAHAIVASALFDSVDQLLRELRCAKAELSRGESHAPD